MAATWKSILMISIVTDLDAVVLLAHRLLRCRIVEVRPNLADIDKIALAVKMEELLRPIAKVNEKAGGGDKKSQSTRSEWANLPTPIYVCKSCGESFDREVWHCRECAHHWSMNDDECRNCHKGHRHGSAKAIKAGSVVTRRESAATAGVGERT